MHAVDTSLLYALFDARDQWHEEARRLVQEHRPILVPPGTLQETLDLLAYRHGIEAARKALEWLTTQPAIRLDPQGGEASHHDALRLFLDASLDKGKRTLSFADAWCLCYARHTGAGLLTKDWHQAAVFAR